MADRIQAHDWGSTPLGPMAFWPQSLKTVLNMMVATPQCMCLAWGPELTLIYNDSYAPLLGLRHPEALGRSLKEVWADVWPDIGPLVEQTLSGEAVSLADMALTMTRNGSAEETWWTFTYSPIHDDAGEIVGLIVITSESTERVLAARKSADAAQRLDMALSAGSGVGTWDWDVLNDRVVADARFATIYGVDPDKASQGAPLQEFFHAIHPTDAPRVQGEIARALSTGQLFRSEYRLVGADGDVRWVAAEGQPLRGDDGVFAHFPGVTFDITDRRQISDA